MNLIQALDRAIRTAMAQAGIVWISDLAERAGVTRQTITSTIQSGSGSLATMEKIAEACDTTVAAIYAERDRLAGL